MSTPRRGASYRDDLAHAYQRIAELEARTQELESQLASRKDVVPREELRDLDAAMRRWDRVRATLALLLGLTGLFALTIAERWDVRTALLATCMAMVAVGITLAWPKIVRANADPKPHAKDVSLRGRRQRRSGVRVDVAHQQPTRLSLVPTHDRHEDVVSTENEQPVGRAKVGGRE